MWLYLSSDARLHNAHAECINRQVQKGVQLKQGYFDHIPAPVPQHRTVPYLGPHIAK